MQVSSERDVRPVRPIVIGAPRSGFSLLIQVVNSLQQLGSKRPKLPARAVLLNKLVDLTSWYLTSRYKETFARFGIVRDLIFNGEFHLAVGGPKWVDKDQPTRACIRKYFGVRGMGDFLLVTSHPREILEYHSVLHSHTSPSLWVNEPYYEACPKLTSIRNPIGIINSASFSLNAMASEYIQRFMGNANEDFIRQRMGLYKLTDLDVVRGLVQFLRNYLDEYFLVRDRYFVMKWEDLIQAPAETIQRVAGSLGITCSYRQAEKIWRPMDHINLLQFHKHNYRHGKGIVGDWKNSLVNEHMELFRECDFDRYLKELGYHPTPDLDHREYSPYQKLVERYIRRNEVYRNTGDESLFGLSFNKSNIDASSFGFKSYPQRKWTHVERSTLAREEVVEAISDVAEESCEQVNELYAMVLNGDFTDGETRRQTISEIRKCTLALMQGTEDVQGLLLCDQVFNSPGSVQ